MFELDAMTTKTNFQCAACKSIYVDTPTDKCLKCGNLVFYPMQITLPEAKLTIERAFEVIEGEVKEYGLPLSIGILGKE